MNLNGTGSSDPDGDTLGYSWEQTGGSPTVTLAGANTATPSFTAPTGPATLTFTLTVNDGNGGTDTDTVVVTVNAPEPPEEFKNPAKACKAERARDPIAFKQKYRNFGDCVSQKAHERNGKKGKSTKHRSR